MNDADIPDPIILTLRLDDSAFDTFDRLRAKLFPDRGFTLPAHLTLFHQLPGDRASEIAERLEAFAAETPSFSMRVTEVLDFGGGAAFAIESDRLKAIRGDLAADWEDWLTPQDRGFRPHVTVQNKVDRATAKPTVDILRGSFEPYEIDATGFLLWRYRSGPWEMAGDVSFAAPLPPPRTGGIE